MVVSPDCSQHHDRPLPLPIVSCRWKACGCGSGHAPSTARRSLSGAHYWSNTVTCLAVSDLVISHGVDNLLLAVRKSPLLLAGIAASAVLFTQTGWRRARPESVFLFLTRAFSLAWNFQSQHEPASRTIVRHAIGREGSSSRLNLADRHRSKPNPTVRAAENRQSSHSLRPPPALLYWEVVQAESTSVRIKFRPWR